MRYRTELMDRILTNETAQRIIDFVSQIYGESYVGLWLYQAIGAALEPPLALAETLSQETNPATASLLLDLWEKSYGLPTDHTLTEEQRQARLIDWSQNRGACNPTRLAAAVSAALNGAKVTIAENTGPNAFTVYVSGTVPSLAPARAVLDARKPAHLSYSFERDSGEDTPDLLDMIESFTFRPIEYRVGNNSVSKSEWIEAGGVLDVSETASWSDEMQSFTVGSRNKQKHMYLFLQADVHLINGFVIPISDFPFPHSGRNTYGHIDSRVHPGCYRPSGGDYYFLDNRWRHDVYEKHHGVVLRSSYSHVKQPGSNIWEFRFFSYDGTWISVTHFLYKTIRINNRDIPIILEDF